MNFNYLRRHSLFDDPSTTGVQSVNPNALQMTPDMMEQDQPQVQGGVPQQQPQPTLADMYQQIGAVKSGPLNQRYKDFLSEEPPRREDYKPGKMAKLAAIMAGGSEGLTHGAGAGFKLAQNMLDDGYNQAYGDYAARAKRLETSAGLEDKEDRNNILAYRDFNNDAYNRAKAHEAEVRGQRLDRLADSTIGLNTARGNSFETPAQRQARMLAVGAQNNEGRIKAAGASANARINYFNQTEPTRQANRLAVVGARGDQARTTQSEKYEQLKEYKQYLADNVNPDIYDYKVNKAGMVVGVNKHDPLDVIVTKIDTGKLDDREKIELGLKAKQDLKRTPAPARETVTTVDGNKRDTINRPVEGPTQKVSVIGPKGEVGLMSATEFEEAKKHGWKAK